MTRTQFRAEVEQLLANGDIYQLIRRLCSHRERRKELGGELVRKLYELGDDSISGIRSVRAYIIRAIRNLVIDLARNGEGSLLHYVGNHEDVEVCVGDSPGVKSDLFPSESCSAEESAARAEVQAREKNALAAAIKLLSPQQQQALILRLYGGLDNTEGARVLGCGKRTFEKHVTEALKNIRKFLEQQFDQPCQGGSNGA